MRSVRCRSSSSSLVNQLTPGGTLLGKCEHSLWRKASDCSGSHVSVALPWASRKARATLPPGRAYWGRGHGDPRERLHRRLDAVAARAGSAGAAEPETIAPPVKRVLALFDFGKDAPANVTWDATLREVLGVAASQPRIEYYTEFFDALASPAPSTPRSCTISASQVRRHDHRCDHRDGSQQPIPGGTWTRPVHRRSGGAHRRAG